MNDKNNITSANYYRSANLDASESIDMIDRYILLCLMLGLQGNTDISTISISKIQQYCDYVDDNDKKHTFGEIRIKESLNRLEKAGRIKILPQSRGKCTQYRILIPEHYEKVNKQFYTQNISPAAKGYILCHLQHNKNKDSITHQPNNINTRCDYNIDYMKELYHDSTGKIRRAEKELESKGMLSLKDTGKRYTSNQFPIVERVLNLDKAGLAEFVVKSIIKNQHDIQEIKDTFDDRVIDVLIRKGVIKDSEFKSIDLPPESYEFK